MTASTQRQVFSFPGRPTRDMVSTLPVLRRLEGVAPWRPHVFMRALLATPPDSDIRAGGVVLMHLLRQREFAWTGQNASWDKLLESFDVSLEQLPIPPPEVVTGLWRPGLKHLQSFDLSREWVRLVQGGAPDAPTVTPRPSSKKLPQPGAKP